MKIGILTFHEADSYGAVLQAYALQQTLTSLGADSEFVQIETPQSRKPAALPIGAAMTGAAMAGAAAAFARCMQAERQKRAALFAQFRQEHLRISRTYAPTENIDDDFDCFVAGSDQIWNFQIPGADARYFLPFAKPEKRYSYAASFGADALPEKAQSWAAAQLKRFQGLSVREESGKRIIKELTGQEAQVCLDPTLLPERAQWEALTQPADGEDYALLFMLKYDEVLVQRAAEEAKRRGVKLRTVTAAFMPQMGMAAWNTTGVTDWLSAIRGAGCVFTNSFHGLVFSMIFRRSFHVQRLTGELSTRNGRLEELLTFLQCTDAFERVVEPDYDLLRARLEPRRRASLDYLRGIAAHDAVI